VSLLPILSFRFIVRDYPSRPPRASRGNKIDANERRLFVEIQWPRYARVRPIRPVIRVHTRERIQSARQPRPGIDITSHRRIGSKARTARGTEVHYAPH